MQLDLFINPNSRTRAAFPLVVVLQADIAAEGERRLVAPVAPHSGPLARSASRALPVIEHDGSRYAVALPLISTLPRAQLHTAVGSIAQHRADISRALDWLFFGI
jgi:toxin CcdB